MPQPRYKRLLVKLSGEALCPAGGRGIDPDAVNALIDELVRTCRQGDRVVIMSNGGFEGIHQRLLTALQAR